MLAYVMDISRDFAGTLGAGTDFQGRRRNHSHSPRNWNHLDCLQGNQGTGNRQTIDLKDSGKMPLSFIFVWRCGGIRLLEP